MKDTSICDGMLKIFNTSKQNEGKLYEKINPSIKKSTDVFLDTIDNRKEVINYLQHLQECVQEYVKKYNYCDKGQLEWRITEWFNIQRYKLGEGFYQFHSEKGAVDVPVVSRRHLVFMTYLNNMEKEGGETEWLYQKLKIKPKKGLTVIWPAEWMFTHRGIASMKEVKYIVTGWYSFV